MTTIAIFLLAWSAVLWPVAVLTGAAIHRGNPSTERPIRTVRLRGDVVDMVV